MIYDLILSGMGYEDLWPDNRYPNGDRPQAPEYEGELEHRDSFMQWWDSQGCDEDGPMMMAIRGSIILDMVVTQYNSATVV